MCNIRVSISYFDQGSLEIPCFDQILGKKKKLSNSADIHSLAILRLWNFTLVKNFAKMVKNCENCEV